jgi:RES domain
VKLYRVLPYDPNAAPDERGGVLFRSGSPFGRIANPSLYKELYLAATPEAAVAETFGRFPVWRPSDFIHASGVAQCLATYNLDDATPLFDLNDIDRLKTLGIVKPSDIVTRDRTTTQTWSATIFNMSAFHGAIWWSYYQPTWQIFGLWDLTHLSSEGDPVALTVRHIAVVNAAATIVRQTVRD